MKKSLLLLLLFPLFLNAQIKQNYIYLGFASTCCGPPDGKPVFDYIKMFKQKHSIVKLDGYFFGLLGPEGEHSFLINIKKLSDSDKTELIA